MLSLNMARSLKFRIQKVEGSYYPRSENKGADQLRGYREADLGLCFRIYKNPVFSQRGTFDIDPEQTAAGGAVWSGSALFVCLYLFKHLP